MFRIIIILTFLVPFSLLSNIWKKAEGPYQYSPAYTIFSFNNELYTSTLKGGNSVYKLNGDDWERLDTGFFSGKGLVHFFNQKNNVVFTSTDSGIYLSYDSGNSWKHFEFIYGNKRIEFVSIVDEIIFFQASEFYSLYKIEKGSDTIEKIYTDKEKTDSIFADIIITKDNYIFAADPVEHFDAQNKDGKLYISKDKGVTWALSESMKKKLVNLLLYDEVLLAFTNKNELYKSTDYGITWTTDTSIQIRGEKVIANKDLIFACSNQVNVSSDGGESWVQLQSGLDRTVIKDLLLNNGIIYFLTDRGIVYYLDEKSQNWVRQSPITEDLYQGLIIESKDTLFSTGGFTMNYSVDNGESWGIYSDSLYFKYTLLIRIYIRDSVMVVVNNSYTSIYISNDYGKSWRFENLGIISNQGWIRNVIIMDNRILLTTSKYGNYLSEDAGLTWGEYYNNILKNDIVINNYFRFSDTDLILYSDEGLYKSYDNGLSWEFEKAIDEVKVHSLTAIEGNNLYSLFFDNTILKSTDLGITWSKLELNLDPELIFIRMNIYNGYIILFTTTDVYVSSNDGIDWIKYEVDLLTPDGKELFFNYGIVSGEYLVLTSSYGNWRAKLSDLGIEVKSSVESEIERNYLYTYPPYPNPAKSEVKVLFYWDINLPMRTDDISIYDITGKKIDAVGKLSLVKQESHYGNIIWDCSSAQPGIYLINIKHGTEEKAVKVVVE